MSILTGIIVKFSGEADYYDYQRRIPMRKLTGRGNKTFKSDCKSATIETRHFKVTMFEDGRPPLIENHEQVNITIGE